MHLKHCAYSPLALGLPLGAGTWVTCAKEDVEFDLATMTMSLEESLLDEASALPNTHQLPCFLGLGRFAPADFAIDAVVSVAAALG